VAIARVERLAPFPDEEITRVLERYPNLTEIVWAQEEPRNMGAWHYIEPNLEWVLHHIDGKSKRPRYVGRAAAAATATGLLSRHLQEQKTLVEEALAA
jgi:2-oxoglutarate dehydrogenase E1 component